MEKKQRKTYSKEERIKKNKRFNTVLYIISGLLILTGIIIIISDTTLWFDKLFHPENFSEIPIPTGSYVFVTQDPNTGSIPSVTMEPGMEIPIDPGFDVGEGDTDTVEEEPTDGSTPRPPDPDRPVKIYFADYDVVCPIDQVGFNWKGQMATVRAHNRAAWLKTSGTPSEGGNIILAGHNKYSGKLGYFDVVKSKLKVGDIIILEDAHGDYYYYAVTSIDIYLYNEVPASVMQTGGEARLTLITCKGDFDASLGSSKHRVIAVCHPIQFGNDDAGANQDNQENN